MNKYWLKYLGFLGFVGVLGFFNDNPGFYGFFGFFSFFGFFKLANDERLLLNANKAARNAFVISIISFLITSIYANLVSNFQVYAFSFAITFGLQMIVFAFSFQYYDQAGD